MFRWTIVGLGLLASSLVLVSCSNANSNTTTRLGRSPGTVALNYVRDVYSGRFSEAENFVTPKQRSDFKMITLEIRPHSVSSNNLKVGSVAFSKSIATVILTGQLCSTTNTNKLNNSPGGKYCVRNSNPHGTGAEFQVKLSSNANGVFLSFSSNDVRLKMVMVGPGKPLLLGFL